jgi:hypothetical protein
MVLHYQCGAKGFSSVTYHKPGIDFLALNYYGCVGLDVLYSWPYPYYFMKIDTPEAPFWYFFIAIVHMVCVLLSLLIAGVKHKIYVHLFSSKAATNAADVRRPLLETST